MALATGKRLAGPTVLNGTEQTIYTVTAGKRAFARVIVAHYTGAATTVIFTLNAQVIVAAYPIAPNTLPYVLYEGWFAAADAIKLTGAVASRMVGIVDGVEED